MHGVSCLLLKESTRLRAGGPKVCVRAPSRGWGEGSVGKVQGSEFNPQQAHVEANAAALVCIFCAEQAQGSFLLSLFPEQFGMTNPDIHIEKEL